MKKILFVILIPILMIPLSAGAVTLQQMYDSSRAGLGYDKLIELQKDSIYTGGISLTDQRIGIKGHGVLIDLQGGSISVTGNSVLDIDGCVIINGSSAIYAEGDVVSRITHCTFYGNQIGIHFMCLTGQVEVVNTILASNNQYGFASEETTVRILHYIDTYNNLQGDYMEWCPT